MRKRWRGKVVVVTGATAGVGRAVVREFARRGAALGLLARDEQRLEETRAEVEALGGCALALPVDVAYAEEVERAAARIEEELGEIDVWINNAMVSVFAEMQDIEPEEFRRVTDVTFHGTVWGTMSALRRMLPRDRGRIVLVGSALAWRGIPLQSAYCAAKHAVLGMFESLRTELLHRRSNVSVGVVHLPAINTPQFDWVRSKLPRKAQPVPPIFQPEIPARAIELSARSKKRSLHVGFVTSKVIWGSRIAPAVADRVLARSGYRDQMTDEMEDPDRADNLFESVPGDWAAHGRFDARARRRSVRLWLRQHPAAWLLGTAAVVAALTLARRTP
jgi:NAD(P)-dependent dehydrogenase (short-subunit alcohol dehydrogenase family)